MRRGLICVLLVAACDDTGGTGAGSDASGGGDGAPMDGRGGTDGAPSDAPSDAPMMMIDAAPVVGEPPELAGITAAHNAVRAMVSTSTPLPALQWDEALEATAAAWVAQCRDMDAPAGLIDHNPNRSTGHPYYVGENVYASGGTATATAAVNLWAAEKANYSYPANTCNGVCGHYTQIVWRTTLKVGCARGNCAGLAYPSTIVCNYGPGGNTGGLPY